MYIVLFIHPLYVYIVFKFLTLIRFTFGKALTLVFYSFFSPLLLKKCLPKKNAFCLETAHWRCDYCIRTIYQDFLRCCSIFSRSATNENREIS
jgi:hypothetical protein